MRIYDDSNSPEIQKLKPRVYGPKENDIVRYLKENAWDYGHSFVETPDGADVIFTNDIFSREYLGKFKVKRMDGVFSQLVNRHRNLPLNRSAQEADRVIFISNFSRDSYFRLYGAPLKAYSVIPNGVDPRIFYPAAHCGDYIIAVASDWTRPEKRLGALLDLAGQVPCTKFVLVGALGALNTYDFPSNVQALGYAHTPRQIADTIRGARAMISLSYKDPHPKTMVQGVYCGLPIFYAGSGGQPEIHACGLAIEDKQDIEFEGDIPALDKGLVLERWQEFESQWNDLRSRALAFNGGADFREMLGNYFKALAI